MKQHRETARLPQERTPETRRRPAGPARIPETRRQGDTEVTPPDSGETPQISGDGKNTPSETGKKRIRRHDMKGKKLIVGARTVEFDAEGTVCLDTAEAEYLLSIPGYEAV
jgi:hypothetical protein